MASGNGLINADSRSEPLVHGALQRGEHPSCGCFGTMLTTRYFLWRSFEVPDYRTDTSKKEARGKSLRIRASRVFEPKL